MELDAQEVKNGNRWLVIAGSVSIIFALALYMVDNKLHSSTYESDKAKALTTLRTAQYSLPSHVTDSRQNQEELYKLRAVYNNEDTHSSMEAGSTHEVAGH